MDGILQRAYELADSGLCKTTRNIRERLCEEGYAFNALSRHGRTLMRALTERCRAAYNAKTTDV